jgi:GT2 family glycosyltransferase
MYNTPKEYFEDLVSSLKSQTYTNWELCLGDGSQVKAEFIDEIIADDERIKYKKLEKNEGISGNTNQTIKMANGDYLALLDHDDILPEFSLYEIVKAINENDGVEFIYSDEDKILEVKGRRMGPHFKPDYAPDTLRSYNYICHFSVFKKELMDKLGGFRDEYNGSQDYDIILRATEIAKKIVHIPKILYHWRINENSVASSASAKPYAYVAAKEAIRASLKRQNIDATVEDSCVIGLYKLTYKVIGNPKVSIIILNKDHVKDLKLCINSIIKKAGYDKYEIIIVENNSTQKETFDYYNTLKENKKIKVITYKGNDFNYSKLNNLGVKKSTGDYLLFMNNDIEILSEQFLSVMLGTAQRKDVGAVGGKLLYKDGTIQHAGIVLNFTGVAGHINAHLRNNEIGYMGRVMIQQNFSAVTGALLMVGKDKFEKVKGFDEEFPIAYNDVDLCIKLLKENLVNVYDPYVYAYHYESKTRGYEDTQEKKDRLIADTERLKNKHKEIFAKPDPYFNVNFRHDVPDIRIEPNHVM